MKKLFGKKKLDEKKIMAWVNTTLEEGSDMEQISKVLNKKYPKKEVEDFLKKNYSIEPEAKPDKKLKAGLEEEKKIKEEKDELDTEMTALKAEAKGEEPKEVSIPEEVPEAPKETPKGTETKPEEVPIDDMSTYKVELIKLVASINQGIRELIEIMSKK